MVMELRAQEGNITSETQSRRVMVDAMMTERASAASFGELLKRKRREFRAAGRKVSQSDIARALGISQSYVSGIENGLHNPWRMSAKQTEALLREYGFSHSEAEEVVRQYGLNYPLSRVPATTGDTAELPYLGVITYPEEVPTEKRYVPMIFVSEYEIARLLVRDIGPYSMADIETQQRTRVGASLIIDAGRKPEYGNIVVCRIREYDDLECLRVYGRRETDRNRWIMSFTPGHNRPPLFLTGSEHINITGVAVGQYLSMINTP